MFLDTTNTTTRALDFMSRLAASDRQALLDLATQRPAKRGDVLFKAGSPGDGVYLLESGRVKVYHLSATGKEVVLWYCTAGEIFGLAEICQVSWRQVYAEACEPSQVLTLSSDDFRKFLLNHPAVALLVADVLAARLRSLGHLVQGLVASEVDERVTQLLLRLAAQHGVLAEHGDVIIDLRLTHQELANMIGTTRQSVNAVLNDLQRRQLLITTADRRLRLKHLFFVASSAATATKTEAKADNRL